MIVLESLFILPFFLLVATEDKQNGSVYSQPNNTVLHNATNVSVPHNDSHSKEQLVTELPNLNNSVVTPQPNNSWVNNNTTHMNNSVPDSLEVTKFLHLDYSSYEENFAFFSKDFAERLRAWNKTLNLASRQCIKPKSVIGENLTINFPVFQAKNVDHEVDFLTLEAVHPVLVRKRSRQDLVNVAYLAILELWPLLVLCFSCAALSGMIIWLLVSIN